ncbi:MAG: SPFH domain-containing protein, partial [Candidatus Dormibacteraeota bacterium]|nr:SPFH domain-containing protein [Candidatus Dormibacteraeota bacterium]
MESLSSGGADFDLVAASIRADASDLRTFLNVLAVKLEGALPGRVTVQRDGGLFAREKSVRLVKVVLGPRRYELEWAHGDVIARVGGSGAQGVLSEVSLDQAIDLMSRDLVDQARTSTQSKAAMDGLLAGHLPADTLARPAEAEGQIVYRWPNPRTSRSSQLLVNPDEQVVLVHDGTADGPILPGRHSIDAVSPAADPAAADPAAADLEAQIYFVLTREIPNQRFGGMIDKVVDPQTSLAVGLRVFGEYSLRVVDPKQVVLGMGGGQQGINNATFTDLMRDLLLKVLREDVVAHITEKGWPILGLAAHGQEIESETLKGVQTLASGYGLEISRMGNFTISMKDEDEALLTAHRLKLAEAAAGAGQQCGNCGTANLGGARFCLNCGSPLAAACPQCGTSNPSSARFCQSCGSPLATSASV